MAKAPRKVTFEEEDEPTVKPVKSVAVEEVEEAIEEVAQAAPVKTAPVTVEVAPKVEAKAAFVRFTCFQKVDPAPTVGPFDFIRDQGITILEKNKTYTMPSEVAYWLMDKKIGIIVP